jgi:hypothetical protein
MKSLLLTASVLAVLSASASAVSAADLGYNYSPSDRYSSPYDDPRYRDLYGTPPRYAERYEDEERTYREPAPAPKYGYRDEDEDDLFGPRRYAEDYRYGRGCVPRYEIKRNLIRDGWHDFHALELRPGTASVRARRPNGKLFELRVDRCTGDVVDARPVDRFVPGPYAYGPRRWQRPYY